MGIWIKVFELTPEKEHVKKRRPVIGPNYGFIEQLLELDEQLFGKKSIEIEEYIANDLIEIHDIQGDTKWVKEEALKCKKEWDKLLMTVSRKVYGQ